MARLKQAGVVADDPGQVGRFARSPLLLLCAAALAGSVPAAAAAAPDLPPGAGAPPVLPPGVKPADAPVHTTTPQAPSSAGRLLAPGKVASASAATSEPWATVNICDTEKTPNGLGVRASMPGNGREQLMFMRFIAQYWSPSRAEWITVPGGGTSRWVYAGSARFAARQTGWTFFFDQPPAGTTFVMRSIVEQQWRAEASGTRALKRGAKQQQRKRTGAKRLARKQAAKRHAAKKHAAKRGAKKQVAKRHLRKRAARKRSAARRVHEKHASTGKQLAKRKAAAKRKRAAHQRKRAAQRSRASGKRARLAVVKSETLLTKTGYEGVDGGDPVGTSKAMCLIW